MAIGILSVMMLLVGQIFDLTVQSTGQATAVIEINQSLRMLEKNLREDLEGVVAERSMLAIKGIPIAAYWTAAQKEGNPRDNAGDGYPHEPDPEREDLYGPNGILLDGLDEGIGLNVGGPPYRLERPRADILMFFTDRTTASAVYPAITPDMGMVGSMVVYGHAELGELLSDGQWDTAAMPTAPAANSVAANWHLARRSVGLLDASRMALHSMGFSGLPVNPNDVGLMAPPNVPNELILNGRRDIIVRDKGVPGDLACRLFFKRQVLVLPECGTSVPVLFNSIDLSWTARSKMDLTPPPAHAHRLGHYFLPNCASFKVEWGLDAKLVQPDGSVEDLNKLVWVDPVDIPNSALAGLDDDFINDDTRLDWSNFQPGMGGRFDPIAPAPTPGMPPDWTVGSTHVFLSADYDGGTDPAPDPYFPKALRITVDMFDRPGNLVRPIRHVMVIPVGGKR